MSTLAKNTDVFIFCDFWKKRDDEEKVLSVWSVIEEFERNNNFRKVYVEKSTKNMGLAKSVIQGVSKVINTYGKVITLEDDLITSPDFLTYMNNALDYYQSDNQIWSITGYTFWMKAFNEYQFDVYFSGRCCSWGWATWKDRWELTDWDMNDYLVFLRNRKAIKAFSMWGDDMPLLLKLQNEGKIDSWAIRWCYSAFKNNAYSVYPTKSYVSNCGFDGTGTHSSKPTKGFESYYFNTHDDVTFIKPFEDKKIRKQFNLKYSRKLLSRIIRKLSEVLH